MDLRVQTGEYQPEPDEHRENKSGRGSGICLRRELQGPNGSIENGRNDEPSGPGRREPAVWENRQKGDQKRREKEGLEDLIGETLCARPIRFQEGQRRDHHPIRQQEI